MWYRVSIIIGILMVSFFCIMAHSDAYAIVLTFEDISGMGSASIPVPSVSQLYDQYLGTYGIQFTSSSGTPYVAVVNLGLGHAVSGVNGLGGVTASGILTYGSEGNITASFFDPLNPGVPGVIDYFGLTTDTWGDNQQVSLAAYDLNDNLIDQLFVSDHGSTNLSFSRSSADIHKIQFFGSGTAAVDNITFNQVHSPVVPELNSIVLMGLGMVGFLFRRRISV